LLNGNFLSRTKPFEKIFNREKRREKNIKDIFKEVYENWDIKNLKFDKIVGKPFKAHKRVIYPILEIAAVGNKMQNLKGVEIFPIALVIEESGEKYVISLTGEEINPDEFIEMISKKSKD
jgi:uncharacterized spore protein YtfJ